MVTARLSIFGNAIEAGPTTLEPDINNAGTLTGVISGSYTGGTTITVGEVEINQGTPDEYRYRTTTGCGGWSAWSTFFPIAQVGFTILCDADVGGAQEIHINQASMDTGVEIAAALQVAIQALGGVYATVTCAFAGGVYVITGNTGVGKSVVITNSAENNIADELKLGVANGGTEVAGGEGTPATSTSDAVPATTIVAITQDLFSGLKVLWSSTTLGADGDKFYLCSHWRRMLRFTIPTMVFENLAWDDSTDFNRKTETLYHTSASGGTKPSINIHNIRAAVYS